MRTVLEPFRKLDSVSSSKDRFMEIYWNRQKASLWQETMGNTQTGVHAHTETVETVPRLASRNMSLPIIRFSSRFPLFLGLS